jgi:hypothetical protein
MTLATSQGYGDFIVLGGQKSPGLCDVSGAGSPRKWDQAQGYGMTGAVSRYLGAALSEFSVKFRLYGPNNPPSPDWKAWNDFEKLLMKPPVGARARALDIWHPELERLKIKAVGVVDVGQAYQSDNGEWTIEVKFIEFKPQPKISLAKVDASKATKPKDEWELLQAGLTGMIEVEAAGGDSGGFAGLSPSRQLLTSMVAAAAEK